MLLLHSEVFGGFLLFLCLLSHAALFVFTLQLHYMFLRFIISSSLQYDLRGGLRFYSNLLPTHHLFSGNFQFIPAMTEILHDSIFAKPSETAPGQKHLIASQLAFPQSRFNPTYLVLQASNFRKLNWNFPVCL